MLARWRWHRTIESRFGRVARLQAKAMSDLAFGYYTAYLNAGIEHAEALRLATLSERMGDDITNHPELAHRDD